MKPQGEPAGQLLEMLERREQRVAAALYRVYPMSDAFGLARQMERYAHAVHCFIAAYGPSQEVAVFRAPGRLNLLEYLDMAHGPHLSAALDRDMLLVAARGPRDALEVVHCEPRQFPPLRIEVLEELRRMRERAGDATWAEAVRVHPHAGREQGDYANYLLAPLLRLMWEGQWRPLNGMQWALGPSTIPMRAGLSSSSALVVLSYLAALWCDSHRPSWSLQEAAVMLGEAEWYVGTRGGCNDHMTILLNPPGGVVLNHHEAALPWAEPLPFPDDVEILLIHTLWEADKAMGALAQFNARKGEMDLAAALIKKRYPHLPRQFRHLGSLDPVFLGTTEKEVEHMVESLPELLDVDEAAAVLGMDRGEMVHRYPCSPRHPYKLRRRARFFRKEIAWGSRFRELFLQFPRTRPGLGEREELLRELGRAIRAVQELLREEMEVSSPGIDDLVGILDSIPGVLGSKLTGAGFGGCVAAFFRKGEADRVAREVLKRYFVPSRVESYRRQILEVSEPTARQGLLERLEEGLAHPERAIMRIAFAGGAGRVDF